MPELNNCGVVAFRVLCCIGLENQRTYEIIHKSITPIYEGHTQQSAQNAEEQIVFVRSNNVEETDYINANSGAIRRQPSPYNKGINQQQNTIDIDHKQQRIHVINEYTHQQIKTVSSVPFIQLVFGPEIVQFHGDKMSKFVVIVDGLDLYLVSVDVHTEWRQFMLNSKIDNVIQKYETSLGEDTATGEYILNQAAALDIIKNSNIDKQYLERFVGRTKTQIKQRFFTITDPNSVIFKIPITTYDDVKPIIANDRKFRYGIQMANDQSGASLTLAFADNNSRFEFVTHLEYILDHEENKNDEQDTIHINNPLKQKCDSKISSHRECNTDNCWYIEKLLHFMKIYDSSSDEINVSYNKETLNFILELYQHCLLKHVHKQLYFKFIKNNNIYQCLTNNDQKCDYNKRTDRQQTKRERIKLYNKFNVMKNKNVVIQLLDTIHCYLFHSHHEDHQINTKYDNKFMNDFSNYAPVTETEEDLEILRCYERLMMMGFKDDNLYQISEQFAGDTQKAIEYMISKTRNNPIQMLFGSKKSRKNSLIKNRDLTLKSQNKFMNNFSNQQNNESKKIYKNNDIVDNFGFGVYVSYWNASKKKSSNSVTPKYMSLKQELISNKICTLTLSEYNNTYCKAKMLLTSAVVQTNMKAKNVGRQNIQFGIKPGKPLTINHVISLLVYCNYTELQCAFKQYCRPYDKEQIKHFT
eukprot:150847_1